ncbi:MAG: hypothetical protein AAGK92_10930 [Pseudomonadota bacterium]
MRFVAMGCRSKPRADLFEACALLQTTRGATQEAYAEALMRCLGEAVGKPVRLHAPGVTELSFDEAWLVQLGIASARGDAASLSFLLQSRVALPHRRLVAFLIKQISECFDRI